MNRPTRAIRASHRPRAAISAPRTRRSAFRSTPSTRTERSICCGDTTTRRSCTGSPPTTAPNPVLTLDRSPVDDFHRPRAGQAVQVLRSAAELVTTDGTVEGYVASLEGEAAELTAPYDPDTKTVQFPAALPGGVHQPRRNPAALSAGVGGAPHRQRRRRHDHAYQDRTEGHAVVVLGTAAAGGAADCTPATSGRSGSARRRPTPCFRRGCCAPRNRPTARGCGRARSA